MLYKYCGVNAFSINNIKNDVLWFNRSACFNDHFDTDFRFNIDSDEEFDNVKKILIDSGIPGIYIDNTSREFLSRLARYSSRSRFSDEKYGITCFCNEHDNMLLWSHYANNGSGYCLGFDVDSSHKNAYNFLEPEYNLYAHYLNINYKKDKMAFRPKFSFDNNIENNYEKLLSTKSTEWSYEKETRIFIQSRSDKKFPNIMKYKSEKLTKIFLGSRFTLGNFKKFYEAKIFENKKIYIMTLNRDKYKLDVKTIDLKNLYDFICSMQSVKDNWIFNDHTIKKLNEQYSRTKLVKAWIETVDTMYVSSLFDFDIDRCLKRVSVALHTSVNSDIGDAEINIRAAWLINNLADDLRYRIQQ